MSCNEVDISQKFQIILRDVNPKTEYYEPVEDEIVDILNGHGELSIFVFIMCKDFWGGYGCTFDKLLESSTSFAYREGDMGSFVVYADGQDDWEHEKCNVIEAIMTMRDELSVQSEDE